MASLKNIHRWSTPILYALFAMLVFYGLSLLAHIHLEHDFKHYFSDISWIIPASAGCITFFATLLLRKINNTYQATESALNDSESRYKTLFHELQTAYADMEDRIKVRTESLSDTNQRLTNEIDERRKVQNELDRIVNLVPSLICVMDKEGRFVKVNRAWDHSMGYAEEDLIGHDYLDYIHPEDRIQTTEAFKYVLSGKYVENHEVRFRAGDNTWRWLIASAVFADDEQLVYAGSRDITEIKKAEHALQESEQLLSTLFQTSPVATAVLSIPDGNITDANDAFFDLIGHSQHKALGSTLSALAVFLPQNDYSIIMKKMRQSTHIKNYEISICPDNGTLRTCLLSAEMIFLHNQPHILAILVDITEHKLADKLNRIQEQQLMQADKMASLGALVSGVAHEINNPNTFIMLNTPILEALITEVNPFLEKRFKQEGDYHINNIPYSLLKEKIPLLLDGIKSGSSRIKRIVQDLKDFARQDSGLDFTEVNILLIIESAVRLIENMLTNSTAHFSYSHDEHIPTIYGNGQRLEQVIINLLQNACQALRDRSDAIEIKVRHSKKARTVTIFIKDTGCGISEDNLKYITDPFFTTKRDRGGTGLGLSVSSGIVKEHRGILTFNSRVNEGTTAILILPVLNENETA